MKKVTKDVPIEQGHHLVLLSTIIGILLLFAVFIFLNEWKLDLTVNGSEVVNVQMNEEYKDPGADASIQGTTLFFLNKNVDVQTSGEVDTSTAGEYIITYKASSGKNTLTKKRKVTVKNLAVPTITLNYSEDSYTPYNHEYEEEGFTCTDEIDGDLTSKVLKVENNGIVYYTVTNSSGNVARAERKIIYDDRKGPDITLNGGTEVNVTKGSTYTDSYSAIDDVDGDVTDKVTVEGSVDTETLGDYTLTYTVTDEHGNTSTATRTVHVIKQLVNNTTGTEGNKVIYLTFDDGPWQYTDQLLDILDKYNAKATFFVTSQYPSYYYCIQKEAERGHTVAVHTYSHNYGSIYSSDTAYWNDFNAMNDIIKQYTGSYTTLFRFPGGSSNTISRNYCSGIMSTLATEATSKGYTYFDWNVSSGDAGETTDTNTVYNNVITAITANSNAGYPSVVLQHDIKGFSVNAVESIIQWGLQNGYSFQALTSSSFTAHHGINN